MDLTEHLVSQLRAAKVTPTALAAHIDVSVPFASQILSGKRGIRLTHVEGIASLLGVSLSGLFETVLSCHPSEGSSEKGVRRDNKTVTSVVSLSDPHTIAPPEDPRRVRTSPVSSDEPDALALELLQAAYAFKSFAANANEWYERLIGLAADRADELDSEQAPIPRAHATARREAHRKVSGQSHRPRPRPRGHDRKVV
jgi:transcriptional regulator with XRE-family HTH domain